MTSAIMSKAVGRPLLSPFPPSLPHPPSLALLSQCLCSYALMLALTGLGLLLLCPSLALGLLLLCPSLALTGP